MERANVCIAKGLKGKAYDYMTGETCAKFVDNDEEVDSAKLKTYRVKNRLPPPQSISKCVHFH